MKIAIAPAVVPLAIVEEAIRQLPCRPWIHVWQDPDGCVELEIETDGSAASDEVELTIKRALTEGAMRWAESNANPEPYKCNGSEINLTIKARSARVYIVVDLETHAIGDVLRAAAAIKSYLVAVSLDSLRPIDRLMLVMEPAPGATVPHIISRFLQRLLQDQVAANEQ